MNFYDDMEYDFVPQTITVGRFSDNGFVTCRYNYEKWMNVSIFERLCKFKPNEQRDPEKELKKAIHNAVSIYDNAPMSGFTFVTHDEDLYGLCRKSYDNDVDDIILKDPRGFNIAVTTDNFYYMLIACNGCMKDYAFDHKFAYAWNNDYGRFMLVDAETDAFSKCKSKSDTLKYKIDNNAYVMPRDLKIGKVYLGTDKFKGKYMYLGKMPIYDKDMHKDAFRHNAYRPISVFINDDNADKSYDSMTAESRLVFYRIGARAKFDRTRHPFVFRSSASKIFEREIENEDLGNMFNDKSKKVTYENVKDYMDTCFLFNKIDLSTVHSGFSGKLCSFGTFEKILKAIAANSYCELDTDINAYVYPFDKYEIKDCTYFVSGNCRAHTHEYGLIRCSTISKFGCGQSYNGKCIKISAWRGISGQLSFNITKPDSRHNYYSNTVTIDEIHDLTIKELYDYLMPLVATAKFENGKDIRELDMLIMKDQV